MTNGRTAPKKRKLRNGRMGHDPISYRGRSKEQHGSSALCVLGMSHPFLLIVLGCVLVRVSPSPCLSFVIASASPPQYIMGRESRLFAAWSAYGQRRAGDAGKGMIRFFLSFLGERLRALR